MNSSNVLDKLENVNINAWIIKNKIKTESGEPLNFNNYRFLLDIYADNSPFICAMKAAQIGFTTYEILKSAFEAYNENIDIIYVLPTADDVKQFSGGKTNRIIDNNPVLQSWTADKDSIEQKKFGKATIYYRGCFDEETEILTDSGWKKYTDILVGESLPTINLNTKEIEKDIVKDLTIFQTSEDMVSLKSNTFDVLMTKDHRCIVEDRKTGKLRIKRANKLVSGSSASYIPLTTKGFKKNGDISPQIASVLGWVISEGSYWTERWHSRFTRKDGTMNSKVIEYQRCVIIQKKYKESIREALKNAGISWYEKDKKNGIVGFELSRKDAARIRAIIPSKELTFDLLNRLGSEAMRAIYDSLLLGDGLNKDKKTAFYQSNKTTADAFQALCIFLGYNASVKIRRFKENPITHKKTHYVTQVKYSKNGSVFNKSLVHYTGIAWCPTTNNGTVISRRNGKIFLTGQSWTERTALMISAKKLIVDELDRCKSSVIEQYDSRLQAITNPRKAFFSNPSIPDFGIDKLYKQSDQKKWHIHHSCGKTFVMDEKCIDYDAELYICPFCRHEITDEERKMGEWIKTSDGKWSGYWIPLWITPWTPAKKIAQYKREKSPEYFANFVAGTAYVGGGDKVSAQTIIKCLSPKVNTQSDRVIIGVDTGLPIHIVCANKEGYFYYDTLSMPDKGDPYKELEGFLLRWPKSIIIADQGGDLIGIRALQAKYPGRVFLVWYRRDKKGTEMIEWGKDNEYGKVTADRNRLIQLFIDEMLDSRVTFNGTESEWQEYISHWMNIYRVWEENALGIKEFKWERSGPDHYVHCSIYARIGLEKFSETMAKIVDGEDVWKGVKKGITIDDRGIILGGPANL